jgi:glycosyltransferase involved in cell wall biosynthesis
MKKKLTIITNLYPLPWEPNRATFNKQQFEQLDNQYDRYMLIPVAFGDWFRKRKLFMQSEYIRYVPYFYIPKVGRRFYSVSLFLSILIHSGLWLKRKNNDILFASWAFPEAVAASWLSKIYRSKFFFKVHGSDINLHAKFPARAKQIVSASKNASGIISVSQDLKNKMISIGVAEDIITVIYNGVDHDKFGAVQSSDQKSAYILFVGNLKKEKGIFELLEGFSAICEKFPQYKLIYAGPGIHKKTLEERALQLSIANKVEVLGSINHEQLPKLMASATIVALPSYNEGVPNVILEAMASGTPVLTTNVGGIPEVVNESICGKIITPRNAKEVAAGLEYILDKEWSSEKIKEHSRYYSWEKNKNSLIKLLETH